MVQLAIGNSLFLERNELTALTVRKPERGYHAYMEIWTPVVGEMLVVKIELTNRHDIHTPSTDTEIVGHVLTIQMSTFLMRDMNKAFAEITGAKVNRGAGYGLEVPCVYHLYGPMFMLTK